MSPDGGRRGWRRVVFPDEAPERLDRFLAAATGMSRRAVRRWLADASCRVDGADTRRLGLELETGSVVEADLPEEARPIDDRCPPEARILFEDDWLLAVDKPSGVLSQPVREPGAAPELAMDQIALLWLAQRDGRRPYLRLAHRLDRVTSGVLLLTRRPEAHRPLADAWGAGKVERRYLAVVEGEVPSGERVVTAPIERDPEAAWRFRIGSDGRLAETRIRMLGPSGPGRSRVECVLHTGRTHQVRVHLAHAGWPVAGDTLYGGSAFGAPRPLLHAASLRLPHPRDGREIVIEAPVPEDFGA